jgi:hypothetical protein
MQYLLIRFQHINSILLYLIWWWYCSILKNSDELDIAIERNEEEIFMSTNFIVIKISIIFIYECRPKVHSLACDRAAPSNFNIRIGSLKQSYEIIEYIFSIILIADQIFRYLFFDILWPKVYSFQINIVYILYDISSNFYQIFIWLSEIHVARSYIIILS